MANLPLHLFISLILSCIFLKINSNLVVEFIIKLWKQTNFLWHYFLFLNLLFFGRHISLHMYSTQSQLSVIFFTYDIFTVASKYDLLAGLVYIT